MTAYYNEIDPYAAAWLRNLIKAGHIADGIVDERSIEDVVPAELSEFTQCHFFAGIGVWSYSLRRAGWADDIPVWTGSCPCQPFSAAGKGAGFDDQRHLWPHFNWLIQQCGPAVVFGEQVASKSADAWIDLVQADLEDMGYAFGAVPFPSAGIGAPHLRDRTYWMAYTDSYRLDQQNSLLLSRKQGESCRDTSRRLPWDDMERIQCPDGKVRLREPGLELLVDGNPQALASLRAAGNAINAEAAIVFIESAMESIAA